MDALNSTQEEGTVRSVFITEVEEANAALHLDRDYLLGDDWRIVLLDSFPLSALQADVANLMRQEEEEEIQDEDIPALEEERTPESISMKKDAIRALLKPVERSTDELSPCFCNEPYADTTAKIDNNSHEPVKMPDCPHIFGKCCIVQWLGDNSPSTCPMCRKVVHLPRDRPVTRTEIDDIYSIIDYNY